jgi:hypothetical protein
MTTKVSLLQSLGYFARNGAGVVAIRAERLSDKYPTFTTYDGEDYYDFTLVMVDVVNFMNLIEKAKNRIGYRDEDYVAALYNSYIASVESAPTSFKYDQSHYCIPFTYNTNSLVVNPNYARLSAGRVMEMTLFSLLYDPSDRVGYTTDRSDVTPSAEKAWKSYMGEGILQRRRTPKGYDTFDYDQSTDDIYDDCEIPDNEEFGVLDAKASYSLKEDVYSQTKPLIERMIQSGRAFIDYAVEHAIVKPSSYAHDYEAKREYLLATDLHALHMVFFDGLYQSIDIRQSRNLGKTIRRPAKGTTQLWVYKNKRKKINAMRDISGNNYPKTSFADLILV